MSFQYKTLGDLCDFQNGFAFKSKLFKDSGLPIIRITNIQDQIISTDKLVYFDPKNYKQDFEKYKVEPNDLLIAMSGATTGKIGFNNTNKTFYLNQRVGNLKPKQALNKKYLYYFLLTQVEKNLKKALGSAQPNLNTEQIKNLPLPFPPLPIQEKIVTKLDKIFAEIDKAIEVAEANIRNAEALFQSYISNIKATKSTLGDLVTIKTGKLDSNASEKNGKYPFFTCSKEIFSINDYAFDCEAVLLAGNNASGDFNVKHYKGKFNAYQRTYVITIDAKDRLTYRYLYFQLINALKKFKSISVGANTKFLRIGMIRTLEFPLPKFDEQIKILKKLSTIEEKKELLKNIYLKKLDLFNIFKQSILQQAFNGELVKAA